MKKSNGSDWGYPIFWASSRPLVLFCAFLMAGIFAARWIDAPVWIGPIIAGIAISAAFVFSRAGKKPIAAGLMGLCAFALGAALMLDSNKSNVPEGDISLFADKGKITFQGVVSEPVQVFEKSRVAILTVDRIVLKHDAYMPASGKIRLKVSNKAGTITYGDQVRCTAPILKIVGYETPGVFDRKTFLARRGQLVSASVRHKSNIVVVRRGGGPFIPSIIESARFALRSHIFDRIDQPAGGILAAVLLGERKNLDEKITETFRKGGVAHLLAISGMHIGSIFLISFLLIARLFRFSAKLCRTIHIYKTAALLALIPAFAYAELAGWKISTIRSFIMVFLFAGAFLLDRQRDLLTALAAAATLILLAWPFSLLEPAFQLSFCAVLAIAVIAPRLSNIREKGTELDRLELGKRNYRIVSWLKLSLGSSFAAVAATAPITAYHFNSVAPWAVVSNLAMVPLYTLVVVPTTLFAAALFPIALPVSNALFSVSATAVKAGYLLTETVAKLPGSDIRAGRPSALEICAWYGLFAGLLLFRKRAGKILAALCLVVLIAVPATIHYRQNNRQDLTVTVIDVGQGLSQLVQFPGGAVWLIDGGGSFNEKYDPGKRVVEPFLRYLRIRKLDAIVCSHPHPDHFGGLQHVLENFKVDNVYIADLKWDEDDRYKRFVQSAWKKAKSVQIVYAESAPIEFGPARIRWLYPPKQAFEPESEENPMAGWSLNDRSLTMKIEYGDHSILLPSDAEKNAENFMVTNGVDVDSTVLVVPHHGSRTSSGQSFLDAVSPDSAIVPVGKNNWYGLPSREVMERFNKNGVTIFRTDLDGTVEFITDGRDYSVAKVLE